jgi:hypothetical protein
LAINQIEADSTVDSSLLEYFPLQKGNIWQYRHRDSWGSSGYLQQLICYGDTLISNRTYSRINSKLYRIDSLYCLIEYIDSIDIPYLYNPVYCDSSVLFTNEISTFRFNEIDSSYWFTCYNLGDNLFLPQVRYMGEFTTEVFGQNWKSKLFVQYDRFYDESEDEWLELYGHSFIFLRGLGMYYSETGESSSNTLEGAIINGVRFGSIVSVDNISILCDSLDFTLYQNFPNPFNPVTTIEFNLPHEAEVKISIYDILGREVEALYNGRAEAGSHKIKWNAGSCSSGIYFCRIASENKIKTIKMVLAK